jgi:hypothetical protein
LALIAIAAFLISIGASVFILLPKKNLIFSMRGVGLYEGLYAVRHDAAEVHRRLTYDLNRFWDENDRRIQPLFRAFRLAALAMVVEVVTLAALLSDIII